MQNELIKCKLTELKPHPDNPRGEINEESAEVLQLAEDIRKRGIIQPIVITPEKMILAGHRRRVAALIAGINEAEVVVRKLSPDEYAEDFFIAENMQRQDLSPLEEAKAIYNLQTKLEEKHKKTITKKELERRIQLPARTISQRLAILELPERIQKLFHLMELPLNSATKLLKLKDHPAEIEKFADQMVSRRITLNSLDALIVKKLKTLSGELKQENSSKNTQTHYVPNPNQVRVTRESALKALNDTKATSIKLHNMRVVLDQTCCNCGMMGEDSVCSRCPLPKFVTAVVGRAD